MTRFKDLLGSSFCLGLHLRVNVHESTSENHVNVQLKADEQTERKREMDGWRDEEEEEEEA